MCYSLWCNAPTMLPAGGRIVQIVISCCTEYAIVFIITRSFKVTLLPTYWQKQSDADSFSFYAGLKELQ